MDYIGTRSVYHLAISDSIIYHQEEN